jgi:hypothetical protein
MFADDKPHFHITQQQAFDVQLTTDAGYVYVIEPTKVGISFRHRMRARNVSGGPPVMEMLSRPLPYTQLLPDVTKKLIEATLLVPRATERSITRAGIVSTTSVADDEVPPGIARFIEYVGRPWGGEVEHFNFSITADIGKGQGFVDRCIHTITRPESLAEKGS